MAECTSIYYEELSRGFINLHHIPHAIWAYRRGREGRKIVDLSLLIDAVSDGEKAFDFDRILNHPTETTAYASLLPDILPVEFKIGAKALQGTDTQTTSKHVVNCRSREDILLGLNATALLPFLAGSAITLPDGRRLVDGGVAAGRIPLEQAIHAGCTHILVMVTDKNIPVAQMQRSKQERFAVKRLLRQYPDIEPVRYWHGHEIHKQTTAKLRQAESGGLQKPKITVVRIPDALITGSNETDPNKLFRAARAGEEVMHKLFQPYDLKRDTSITVRPSRIGRK
jgi:predicted patatin/cPLA2 family phospholipase